MGLGRSFSLAFLQASSFLSCPSCDMGQTTLSNDPHAQSSDDQSRRSLHLWGGNALSIRLQTHRDSQCSRHCPHLNHGSRKRERDGIYDDYVWRERDDDLRAITILLKCSLYEHACGVLSPSQHPTHEDHHRNDRPFLFR